MKFIPVADANGASYATFSYQVSDGLAYSGTANMVVDVTAVNDAPTSVNNTITMNEDGSYVLSAADFNYTDVEGGGA